MDYVRVLRNSSREMLETSEIPDLGFKAIHISSMCVTQKNLDLPIPYNSSFL